MRPWLELGANGLRGVMASHNMVESMPMHGNKKFLTDELRFRFGLGAGGYIGSDEGNVYWNVAYGAATDAADASSLWLSSGGDQAMLVQNSFLGQRFATVRGAIGGFTVLLGLTPGHASFRTFTS
jgi:beta-glucosidase-like glycosyl hydrolase